MGVFKTRNKPIVVGIVILFILSSSVFAAFYSYNEKITITDSDGSYMGYVLPYQAEVLFQKYAYLKWKREGFPEANGFPFFLVKGTTVPLPFGLEGEILRVKINSISSSGVDLTIDKSDIITEIEDIPETLPENVEAISDEVGAQIEEGLEDLDVEITEFITQLSQRVDKWVNRGYHSSLHIIRSGADTVEKKVDNSIKTKEAEFAERLADKTISLILGVVSTAFTGIPFGGLTYSALIQLIPSSFRHDITTFLYNIDTDYDNQYSSDTLISKAGATSIFIGNPDQNKYASTLNNELKSLGLPYFQGNKIIGKRTYSEDSIGLIAAIPEEKVWTETTLQDRWDNDKIRLYKTLIAGVSDSGLEVAGKWYTDQLDNARRALTTLASLGGDIADDGDLDLNVLFDLAKNSYDANPEAGISSAVLIQGWLLTGLSSLQEADFSNIDSLGYVVIVKKQGSGYEVLETHTINGYKNNYFLNEYIAPKIKEIVDATEEIQEIVETSSKNVLDLEKNKVEGKVESVEEEQAEEEVLSKVTGMAIKDVKKEEPVQEAKQEESEEEPEKERNFIIKFFIDLFSRWFG